MPKNRNSKTDATSVPQYEPETYEPYDCVKRATTCLARSCQIREDLEREAQSHKVKMFSALMLEVKLEKERKKDPTSAVVKELEAKVKETPDPFIHGNAAIELIEQKQALSTEARRLVELECNNFQDAYAEWAARKKRSREAMKKMWAEEKLKRRAERRKDRAVRERERLGSAFVTPEVEPVVEPEAVEVEPVTSELPVVIDPNEPRYCYCNYVAYGRMVACDNPSCKLEWFHFGCVGLEDDPADDWYCRNCQPPEPSEPLATPFKRGRGRPRKDGMVRNVEGELVPIDSVPTTPKAPETPKAVETPSARTPSKKAKNASRPQSTVKDTHKKVQTPKKAAKHPSSPQRSPTKDLDPVPEVKITVSPKTVPNSKLRRSTRH